jgi:hypothetical protein
MAELSSPLKLFAYVGRENGLMVVGSREAMAELSVQLSAELASKPVSVTAEWPPELVSASVLVGPYIDSKHWRVSFHTEGTVASERRALIARSGPPGWLSVATLVLAVVGGVSLARWAWNAF